MSKMPGIIYTAPHGPHEIEDLFPNLKAAAVDGNNKVRSGLSEQYYFYYDTKEGCYYYEYR